MTKYYCNRLDCELVCDLNDHVKRGKYNALLDTPIVCPFNPTLQPHWQVVGGRD